MAKGKILVVDDEIYIVHILDFSLGMEGYEVLTALDGEQAIEKAHAEKPDLIVLDIMMPKLDGYETCKALKGDPATREIPVILLSAKGRNVDQKIGFEVGADDYITKPFSPREVSARVTAVLRRAGPREAGAAEALRFGDLRINPVARSVDDQRGSLQLTAREFDLLLQLARHPGRVFTRDQLMTTVWDYEYGGENSTVTVHMRRLRAKIEADPSRPRHLKTVWGVGYKFEP